MAIINDAYHNLLKNNIPYSPQFSGGGPVPPRPIVDPFYVPGWFEHQDGNWVLVKAGQTWDIQYSDDNSSWTDASYTAGDEDTWFNMDNEPFRMAKYVRKKDSGSTGNNKILAMNLDMPNYLSVAGTAKTVLPIFHDSSVINIKIKIDHFEDFTYWIYTYSLSTLFSGNNQMATCEIEQYNPELMSVTNTNSMFSGCYSLQSLKGLENWDVSNVTNMSNMFNGCYSLQSLDLSNWDVSNVPSMGFMFYNCYSLQSIKGLENWNVSNVTNMDNMFYYCYSLQSLKGLENWDVSNVTSMNHIFSECYSLQSLNLSNWVVSNVTNMGYIFQSCYSLQSLDLSNWDVSNAIMSYMFYGCRSLQYIKGIENWDTSNVTSMNSMFYECDSLQSLDLSNWNTSKVTTMDSMFTKCYSLQSLDLSNWDVSNVTNMNQMFYYCYSLQLLNLSNWVVSKVTNMNRIFTDCGSLQDLKIKSKPKTIALTFHSSNKVLSNDSLKWMADNFIDISGDDTYTNKTISEFDSTIKSRYYWNYFVEKMTAKGYTIS